MTTLPQRTQTSTVQPLSAAEILCVAGGQMTSPELLTVPPPGAGTETNQMNSPEL
jgi:hypothetical protein